MSTQVYFGFFSNPTTILHGMNKLGSEESPLFLRLPKPNEVRAISHYYEVELCVLRPSNASKKEPFLLGFSVAEINNGRIVGEIGEISKEIREGLIFTLSILADKEPKLHQVKTKA